MRLPKYVASKQCRFGFAIQRHLAGGLPAEGFEPPTYGLQNRCTTTVLSRHIHDPSLVLVPQGSASSSSSSSYICVTTRPSPHAPILRGVTRNRKLWMCSDRDARSGRRKSARRILIIPARTLRTWALRDVVILPVRHADIRPPAIRSEQVPLIALQAPGNVPSRALNMSRTGCFCRHPHNSRSARITGPSAVVETRPLDYTN
jgi:hypothetical protein